MTPPDASSLTLAEGRQRFLDLVADLRPDLHRYCARMVGSAADGEDIVQDTLATAYYQLDTLEDLPALRSWLFRIAHNRALDQLRRFDRRWGTPLEDDAIPAANDDADEALARDESVRAALSRFLELPPTPRSCVILKDVLGSSLDEIAATLGLTLPAIKAALHRGRARLKGLSGSAPPRPQSSPVVARYAAAFNARDWDGVRALLAEDVRVDVVSRGKRLGRQASGYFDNYAALSDGVRLVPMIHEGHELLAAYRGELGPQYIIALTVEDGRVTHIRDYRYVPYIAQDLG